MKLKVGVNFLVQCLVKYNQVENYPFEKNDYLCYLKNLYKIRGLKALYQFQNRPLRRSYSRKIIKKFAPKGVGLEIGVGDRTIAPTNRTILSDAFSKHGNASSLAKVFFLGDEIPYEDGTFSFLLSEHVLEHITNPIKSLKEWIRVLKVGGKLIVFLPHYRRNNDVFRSKTTLEHLISDYENDVAFDDDFHFDEWKELVVDKGLMPQHYKHLNREQLLKSGSIHHHVWSEKEIIELFEFLNLNVAYSNEFVFDRRDSFIVIGEKK